MAQTGYSPIYLYSSSTTGNTPSLTNGTSGSELGINITDGKLFYKDNANALQVIGWKTTPTTAGGTGLTSWLAGQIPYYSSGTTLSQLAIGTSGQILTSSGTAPQWTTLSSVAVTTFSGGSTGLTPNSATSGAITLAGTLGVTNGGTGITSLTNKGIPYATSTSTLTTSSSLLFDGQNVGLSISPSAWGSGNPAIDLGSWSAFAAGSATNASWNAYYDGTNWRRKLPYGVGCSLYSAADQAHLFQYAPSGTAGSTISWSNSFRTDNTGALITYTGVQFGGGASSLLSDYETGTWTPSQGSGLTVVGTFSSSGTYTKIGRLVFVNFQLNATTSIAVGNSGSGILTTNLPFTTAAGGAGDGYGVLTNSNNTITSSFQAHSVTLYCNTAVAATSGLYGSVCFEVTS